MNARTVWEFWHAVHRVAQLWQWIDDPSKLAEFLEAHL